MQEFTVTNLQSPMRLDRYLRILSPELTQGVIEQSLRKGSIKVLGAKATASTRISEGDVINIANYIQITSEVEEKIFTPPVIALAEKLFGKYLIEEQEDFLVINKPAGVSAQGGSNISLSIDHALQYLNSQGHDLRLVHRLDKETSGVMLIAKNRLAATKLGEGFQKGVIKKKYLAVISGKDIEKEGRIESYLMKAQDKVITVDEDNPDGKLAITEYKVLNSHKDWVKLVEFTPYTGRMHQIRCHAAYNLKNPLLGDKKYGGEDNDGLMLHAWRITVPAEIFGTEFEMEAKQPRGYTIKSL